MITEIVSSKSLIIVALSIRLARGTTLLRRRHDTLHAMRYLFLPFLLLHVMLFGVPRSARHAVRRRFTLYYKGALHASRVNDDITSYAILRLVSIDGGYWIILMATFYWNICRHTC